VKALLELTRALSGAVEHADLARLAADAVQAASGASSARFAELREPDAVTVPGQAEVSPAGPRRLRPVAPPPSAPARDVVRRGGPVWLGSRAEAQERFRDALLDTLPDGAGGGAWAFLPLVVDDRLTGVLTLVYDGARAFDRPTRAFLGELASECAAALARGSLFTGERRRADASERARAAGEALQRRSDRLVDDRTHRFERERFARARAEAETLVAVRLADDLDRAQRLTAALALAATERDALAALAEHGASGFGALGLAVLRRAADAGLEVVASAGVPASFPPAGARLGDDGAWAEADVLASGSPSWQQPADVARRSPATSRALRPADTGAWLGVPVRAENEVRGVLSVAFARERAFTPEDRARLTRLAVECASVLSERAARDAAAAQAATTPQEVRSPVAHLAHYHEAGEAGAEARVLGVFSSDAAARDALRELRARLPTVGRAWITCWTVDAPGAAGPT
jgi:hypothetical protein